jgi:hypothetical protein
MGVHKIMYARRRTHEWVRRLIARDGAATAQADVVWSLSQRFHRPAVELVDEVEDWRAVGLAMGGGVISTPPCLFCTANH